MSNEPDATPSAAELAEDKGLDLAAVDGTGKGGRILKSDVEAALERRSGEETTAAEPEPTEPEPSPEGHPAAPGRFTPGQEVRVRRLPEIEHTYRGARGRIVEVGPGGVRLVIRGGRVRLPARALEEA